MKLYFAGGEIGSHRKLLQANGVDAISLSFVGLSRRVKFARPWLLSDHFSDGVSVLLDSGAYTFNKEPEKYTSAHVLPVAIRYMEFVQLNAERATLVTEFDAEVLGRNWIVDQRRDFYHQLDRDKFMPVWHGADGLDELDELASKYDHVAVAKGDLDLDLTAHLNGLVGRYGVKLHGLQTEMGAMRDIRWDSVGSTSWLSPSMYGDTIVFSKDGSLHRYPKKEKDKCRARERNWLEENGFDADKIHEDDRNELLRLSIWSWQKFTASVAAPSGQRRGRSRSVTPVTPAADDDSPGSALDAVADHAVRPSAGSRKLAPPRERPRQMLPILATGTRSVAGDDGEDAREESVWVVSGTAMMRCDTCYVRDSCPRSEPGASCAYEIPVEIETTTDLIPLLRMMISVQTQRVLRLLMIEQLEGGYVESNLGPEIDRLNRTIKLADTLGKGGLDPGSLFGAGAAAAAGYLSSTFGADVARRATALPEPISAEAALSAIESGEIEE